jgi:hypothetical protein
MHAAPNPSSKKEPRMQKRRRFKQVLSLEQRLIKDSAQARAEARKLPPGPEREALLHRAGRDDAAAQMSEWLRLPSFQSNQ